MENFVNVFLDSNIHVRLMEHIKKQGGTFFDYNKSLVKLILETEFQDQSEFKCVNDLPEYDKKLLLDCFSFQLGLKFNWTYSPLNYFSTFN